MVEDWKHLNKTIFWCSSFLHSVAFEVKYIGKEGTVQHNIHQPFITEWSATCFDLLIGHHQTVANAVIMQLAGLNPQPISKFFW